MEFLAPDFEKFKNQWTARASHKVRDSGGAKASKEMIVGLKSEVASRWFWSQNPVPSVSTLFLGLYAYKVRTWLGLG